MAGLLASIRSINGLGRTAIAEPFAGGAGASLNLLYMEETARIFINDADRAIHDFWWSVLNRSREFLDLLDSADISISEWRHQRETYRTQGRIARLRRGFAAFYLNRCNRSGVIVSGGPIGGIKQKGKWKLNARFNKCELRSRCQRVADYRERISASCLDALDFIASLETSSVMFFIDPPYFQKAKTLYLDAVDEQYHLALADRLRGLRDVSWVLTYDDCPEIRKLYRSWARVRPFALQYAVSERRSGAEVLITPKWMRLPATQQSAAIVW